MYLCESACTAHARYVCVLPINDAMHADRCPQRTAAAPEVALRVHVGAVREQHLRHHLVPSGSGPMERRLPAVERTRSETAT